MAHTQSALKHLRQTVKRTAKNRKIKDRIKDSIKALQKLVADKKLDDARAALPKLVQLLDKAAKRHVLHRNRANRLKSVWTKTITTLK